ncbi:helix-turn-helix domain-containing protein [Methylobacterium sp. SyP6R]|uniref:helix-turn-helix domain-containing protein n=1 Tax=Methylobacterium sp. SyP6R TaxID=2718876 RepID=UPI001F26EB7F|nr:helix-turn-helix transcriptional regulator [Methylobacterium sp. SyP6R]MCF4130100.1 helix-turn-helix domain-containing protein [Methylobacterium sp. SyP6R]
MRNNLVRNLLGKWRGKMAGKSANDFDKRLGERISQFRTEANISRGSVAKALGVTQAQLGKYELGINCLKANVLPILASLFGRSIEDFFDENPSGSASASKSVL